MAEGLLIGEVAGRLSGARSLLAQLAQLTELPEPPGRFGVHSEVARVAIGAGLSPAQRRALRLAASGPASQ